MSDITDRRIAQAIVGDRINTDALFPDQDLRGHFNAVLLDITRLSAALELLYPGSSRPGEGAVDRAIRLLEAVMLVQPGLSGCHPTPKDYQMSYRNREEVPCDDHRWRPEVYDWTADSQAALDECCIHCGWSQREINDHQQGFRTGAADCREMLARFVEQGGDAITAASIRANWNPSWGRDPGIGC